MTPRVDQMFPYCAFIMGNVCGKHRQSTNSLRRRRAGPRCRTRRRRTRGCRQGTGRWSGCCATPGPTPRTSSGPPRCRWRRVRRRGRCRRRGSRCVPPQRSAFNPAGCPQRHRLQFLVTHRGGALLPPLRQVVEHCLPSVLKQCFLFCFETLFLHQCD